MLEKSTTSLALLALARFECISSCNSGALGDEVWRRQPVERQRGMALGLESGCLMPRMSGNSLQCDLLGCLASTPDGLLG